MLKGMRDSTGEFEGHRGREGTKGEEVREKNGEKATMAGGGSRERGKLELVVSRGAFQIMTTTTTTIWTVSDGAFLSSELTLSVLTEGATFEEGTT